MKSKQKLIDNVKVKKLKKIKTFDTDENENGWLIDILRATDVIKKDKDKFAQMYVTTAYPNAVKGFHLHKIKVDLFCVIAGTAKLVLIDDRKDSPTKGMVNEFIMGDEGEFMVVRVPPYVKHAFKNIGKTLVYILNCMSPAYDPKHPDEYHCKGDYRWV